ncbi:MAG: Cna B-type domain-containing protein [Acutalibacteraceae bacterium]|nr:Cna B-type domain-containing protein [Acutalibacteraceae bacterium]
MRNDLQLNIRLPAKQKTFKKQLIMPLFILSLIVFIAVFWWLKLVGITLAGDAFCGIEEHIHTNECVAQTDNTNVITDISTEHSSEPEKTVEYICGFQEHKHTAMCYSDISADLESAQIWEQTMSDIPEDISSSDRLVAVAYSQLGYTESTLNFEVDYNGDRQGYTRYGEWYGNPYGKWNNMFTSFCLRYAGFTDAPISANAHTMMQEWRDKNIFYVNENYSPAIGDIVFVDTDSDDKADITAIITKVFSQSINVIQGDYENSVQEISLNLYSESILGYGITSPKQSPVMKSTARASGDEVGKAVAYSSSLLNQNENFIIYTLGNDYNYYAIDGYGNAVRIEIDENSTISANVDDKSSLFWNFSYCGSYDSRTTYYIQNVSTRRYLHPFIGNTGVPGAILTDRWETALYTSSNGVKLRGARQNAYAYLQNNSTLTATNLFSNGNVFYFGRSMPSHTVWLDGTNGGIMSLLGSPDKSYSIIDGQKMTLPTQWQSPDKYNYTLRGWYDIINHKYYTPGSEITVTKDLVLYADWVASSYDIGQYNTSVADTLSTNNFITTRMFDYSSMFNLFSESVQSNISASSHSEIWSLLTSGNNPYNGEHTLNYIFRDWDRGGEDISYPLNHNAINNPTDAGKVYPGLYTERLGSLLFDPNTSFDPNTASGVLGKQYLGTADHLFQFMDDQNDEHFGYYYYDSERNAASYNQRDQRFYVYNYLECTIDSYNNGDAKGKCADFLPFNSPYANTNGKNVNTYNYEGAHQEYRGTTHYMYDSRYNDNGSSANNVGTNFWFGMSVDIDFFLPNSPGFKDKNGEFANCDIYGQDLHFKFSGDDDVWVFVDDELVLDLGGLHGFESGDINFSSGIVTVNGKQTNTIYDIASGEHKLTIYYLERGSSMSNCAIYFNLAPRFNLNIQKEDFLTNELLNGAEFSVYTDSECTIPAQLWETRQDYEDGKPSQNTFTVKKGTANMWGLAAANTYYIKETKPPDNENYSLSKGIIKLTLDKKDFISNSVEVIKDNKTQDISTGFTVYGFRIDEEKQQVYIVVTNAPENTDESTSVSASKKWNDTKNHDNDYVTVYLTAEDSDGTVRRIHEATLSKENNWTHTFSNLPKYHEDGVTEIVYSVEEAYVPLYVSTVEKIEGNTTSSTTSGFSAVDKFENGKTYLLKTSSGYLSAVNDSNDCMVEYVSEDKAKTSPLARWVATVNADGVLFTNEAGQILNLNYSSGSNDCYFKVSKSNSSFQIMKYKNTSNGMNIYHHINVQYWLNQEFYISTAKNSYNGLLATNESNAALFTALTEGGGNQEEVVTPSDGFNYRITNTPIEQDNQTSLTVYKNWDIGMADEISYEQAQVLIYLVVNGKKSQTSTTLNLKNNWTATFEGLPYTDANGDIITYSVEESYDIDNWIPSYSDVKKIEGEIPSYEVTVTNTYRWGRGYELPATGSYGRVIWILSGAFIAIASLVCGYISRHKRTRKGEKINPL